jgi:hypothetical protein
LSASRRRFTLWRLIKYGAAGLAVGPVLIGQFIFLLSLRQSTQDRSSSSAGAVRERLLQTGPFTDGPYDRLLASALGSSDRGAQRFQVVSLRHDRDQPSGVDVTIRWAINDDLTFGSIGNGAETDAFLVFRALYTSNLPIANVVVIGTYPRPAGHGRTKEQTVMILTVDRAMARTVSTAGWDELGPQVVWPMMRRRYVASGFEPLQGE